MPALRTEITEIITGLAMFGGSSVDDALAQRPAALRHVDDATWDRLVAARESRQLEQDFLAAWNNGRAFLNSPDGLRGRPPAELEWKGPHRDPGDVVVPADLRVDRVYLVSCKYLSKVLHNASPWALFVDHLRSGAMVASQSPNHGGDWFDQVAPVEHQELYRLVVHRYAADLGLPASVGALSAAQRRALRVRIPRDWDDACAAAYVRLCRRAAEESARRWRDGLSTVRERRSMLWRLLRLAPAPYFVLGSSRTSSLRLRVDTPWDFAQRYSVRRLEIDAPPAGQAVISWRAELERIGLEQIERIELEPADASDAGPKPSETAGERCEVAGHVELRWSHGRFGGKPEAKVYLDTPYASTPGYKTLR